MPEDAIFDPKNEVKSAFMKWGKVGDWIKGTLTDVREVKSMLAGKEGEMQKVYELKAAGGVMHLLDDKKQLIDIDCAVQPGEFYSVGGKVGIDAQMRTIKPGQVVGIRFVEEKPSQTKGFNPTKVIKVYAGGMDPGYMGESSNDVAVS